MPLGWRHRRLVYDSAYALPFIGTWVSSKGDTLIQVFVRWSQIEPWQNLYFTKSENAGFSWTIPSVINPDEVALVYTPRAAIDRYGYLYVAFMSMRYSPYADIAVYISQNFGNTWQEIYHVGGQEWSEAYHPWCATNGDTFALVYTHSHFYKDSIKFTYRENNTWIQPENVDPGNFPRVVIDKSGYFYVFYKEIPTNVPKFAKRLGQNQWTYYSFPQTGINFEEPNRIMRADPQNAGVIHFVYSLNNYIYYRRFENGSWTNPIPIVSGTNVDFVVEKGGKIHAVIASYANNIYTMKYYVSKDNGNTWNYIGDLYHSKYFCYEKNKRGRGLALIGTEMNNPYYDRAYYQGNDDFSISNKYNATAYNNNKHLARVSNTDDLYMVFSMESDSQDVVTARSLDGGQTWENYKLIGHGITGTPCIWIDPSLPDTATYLWIHPQISNLLQYRKFAISTNSYSPIYTLPIPQGYQINLSFPEISMCFLQYLPIEMTSIKFIGVILKAKNPSNTPCLLAIQYNITDPNNPSIIHYQEIGNGDANNPSISYSNVSSRLKFHCVYK